jgi:uncharacterized protein (DUF2141 family)
MKKSNIIIHSLVLIILAVTSHAAELQVNIDHVTNDKGTLLAQIFIGQDNYKKGIAQGNKMIPAKTGEATLLFDNLEPGEYVVRMFHDENNNQKMDSNAFGMPTEGYGFSNEAIGNMGPPKYKDMLVVITKEDTLVTTKAKMIYL